jgi:nitrogen fixation/metabolism regulation signal transduction histidine kinase
MDYEKSYNLQILIRSILIALNAILIGFFSFQYEWIFTCIFLSVLFIIQVLSLTIFLKKMNREIANFILFLQENDTSLNFQEIIPSRYKSLARSLSSVNQKYKEIKVQEKKKDILLKLLISEVKTGVLITDLQGKIRLINESMKHLFKFQDIVSIQSMPSELRSEIEKFKQSNSRIFLYHGKQIQFHKQILKDENETLVLFTFNDVGKEMNEKELESYNGLIRVLSHEIMNTLTPLSTVVETIKDCLIDTEKPKTVISKKDIEDSVKSIRIIENRTEGLKEFVKRFRQFIHLPEPVFEEIVVDKLIRRVVGLFPQQIEYKNEGVEIINADKLQLEQVLINLLKNAFESVKSGVEPKIQISFQSISENKTEIKIIDNGNGISDDIIESIFIPFFTTKEEGSGIGLPLSRQILCKHNGDLQIESNIRGTTVTITLNK